MFEAYQRALAAFQVGRYDLCEQCVLDALRESPEDVDLVVLLAHCKLATENFAATRAFAQDVIRLDPDDSRGYSLLAWATISDIHYEPVDPASGQKSPDLVAASQVRFRIAAELAERCLELEPDHSSSFGLLAEIERLRGRLPQALAATSRGLALNPEDGLCARTRIRVLTELQRYDESREASLQRLSVDPEDAETHELTADLFLRQRDLENALRHSRQAVRLSPNDTGAQRLYWDCVKARYLFFRPFVHWRFVAQKIQALPQHIRTLAFAGVVVVGGLLSTYVSHRTGSVFGPPFVILSIGLVVLFFSAQRPCMLLVDLTLFAFDPEYRISVNRRRLAIDSGLAMLGLATTAAFVCMAFEIFSPILVLMGGLIASPTIYYMWTASTAWAKVIFAVNLVVLLALGYATVDLFSGSQPGSKTRIASLYAFIGFLFSGIAAPAIYGSKISKRA